MIGSELAATRAHHGSCCPLLLSLGGVLLLLLPLDGLIVGLDQHRHVGAGVPLCASVIYDGRVYGDEVEAMRGEGQQHLAAEVVIVGICRLCQVVTG